jgi:hypothetical protein
MEFSERQPFRTCCDWFLRGTQSRSVSETAFHVFREKLLLNSLERFKRFARTNSGPGVVFSRAALAVDR